MNKPLEKHYKAFISYAHADNREQGRQWANWLHQALETYQIPAELVGQPNQYGGEVPARIYPVFQDEKELSANASLSASLNSALDRSEFLLYISSPRSARSVYVQEEIRHFKRTGRGHRIVTLIVRGEPQYGDTPSDQQCFPDVLRYALRDNGEIDFSQHEEALAADARLPDGEEGYTSDIAYRDALQRQGIPARQARQKAAEYGERLNLAKLKIVSTLLGVPLADLTQRDQAYQLEQAKRKNRTFKKIAAVMTFLTVMAVGAGVYAWQQENIAQRNFAQSLYISGANRLTQNDYGEAAAYIAAAARAGNSNAAQLAESLLAAKQNATLLPNMSAALSAFSPDGRYLVGFAGQGDGQFGLHIWDAHTRTLHEEVPTLASQHPARPLFDGQNRVYVQSADGIARYDLHSRNTETLLRGEQQILAVNHSGQHLIIRDDGAGELQWLNTHTQQLTPLLHDISSLQSAGAVFSDDGTRALVWTQANAQSLTGALLTLDNGKTVPFSLQTDIPQHVRFAENGRHVLLASANSLLLLDTANGAAHPIGTQNTFYRWADFNHDGQSLIAVHAQGYDIYGINGEQRTAHSLPLTSLLTALEDDPERAPDHRQRLITRNKQLYLADSAHDNLLISAAHFPADTRQVLADAKGEHFLALAADGKHIARINAETHAQEDNFITLAAEGSYMRTVGKDKLMVVDRERKVYFYRSDNGQVIGDAIATQARNIHISHDDSRFLARSGDDSFGIWRIADGASLVQYRHPAPLDKFTSDDDFRYLLIAGDKHWQLLDIASGKVLLNKDETLSAAAFSPDSRFLVVAKTSQQSDVYHLNTLQKAFSLPTIATPRLGFSPDGKVLLASQDSNRLRLWQTDSGRAYGAPLPVMRDPQLLTFSADSQRLYLQNYSGEGIAPVVNIIDTASGNPVSLSLMQGVYRSVQLLDDGARLAAHEHLPEGHIARLWQLPHTQTSPPAQLAADLEALYGKQYDPQSGAIDAYHGEIQQQSWYLQDIYSRTVAPDAHATVPEAIAHLLPVSTPEQRQALLEFHFYHPLAKAGLADYFQQQPDTQALAAWLAHLAKKQAAALNDADLRQQILEHLRNIP